MPNTKIHREEIYELVNGVATLKEVVETPIETPTEAEILAAKEAELLAMYEEIQALKQTK